MKTRKLLSILLCTAVILTMIPGFSLFASAASLRSVSDMNQLKSALESSESLNILITKDITLETSEQLGTWCTIRGEKNINLNGYKVELKNKRLETTDNKELMFDVSSGANITISDSSDNQNGKIFHNGAIDNFGTVVIRNVFNVEEGGTLNLESGTITTGRYETVWEPLLARRVTKHTWGTGVNVNGGIFNMYGGIVEGSGHFYSNTYWINCGGIMSSNDNSTINIFNGTVYGYNAAPALANDSQGSWIVQNGKFKTAGTDNSFINGGGLVKHDALPTGVTSNMTGTWSQCIKSNNTPIFASTELEVMCTASTPVIVSSTTTTDADILGLMSGSSLPLCVTAAGGKGPYIYDWQIRRQGESWGTLGSYSQKKIFTVGSYSRENGAQLRCVVTDTAGKTAVTEPITLHLRKSDKKYIENIHLTVTEPQIGKCPGFKAGSYTTGAAAGSVCWYEKTESGYREMKASDTFRAGGEYKVQIYVYSTDTSTYEIAMRGSINKEGLLINGKTVTEHTLHQEADHSLSYAFPVLNPFTDVKPSAYYANPVFWAVNNNITNGTSATTFSPDQTCTRGQVVTFLWRAAGQPQPTTANNPFTDVKSSEYYYKPILWAVEKGITSGMSSSTFEPDSVCTRGQVVTFLWRTAGQPQPSTAKNPFTDVRSGAYYYKAVLWAVENGITSGMSSSTFEPDTVCTRGQVVTFLYRQYNK